MAGDLTKWSEPNIPLAEGDNLKFKRKGGWFVTKKVLIVLLIIFMLIVVIAIYVTKILTEKKYEPYTEQIEAPSHSENPLVIRLPEDIVPSHYQLALKPYLDVAPPNADPFTISGVVVIFFKIIKPTSTIILNYEGDYVNCKEVTSDNKSMLIKTRKYNRNINIYSIELEENLEVGKNYSIQLTFNSTIIDEPTGFYQIKYFTSDNNKERWIGVTQLEPVYARRMFPCFDEPNFRTTFDISVHRLKNESVLSNTNRKSSESDPEDNAWIWDNFERTPAMPTHKLSIVIGDLSVSKILDTTQVSLWTRADLINEALNSIDLIKSLLTYYQSYFTVPQPIKKLDLVAVPTYASENSAAWGIILFSESLLYSNKQGYSEVEFSLEISQKLAEQWVGNLVSINWWTDLLAKNSLTTYIAYMAVNKVRPQYNIKSLFVVDVLQKGLDFNSYPVSNDIRILSDIRDVWSSSCSTYKGASLLSMIASVFSPSNELRDGINNYLERWSEKAVNEDRLWESFISVEKDGIDLANFFTNWKKTSYPTVNVNYDKKSGEVRVNQVPFYLQHPPSDQATWDIPITYITSEKLSNKNSQFLWLKNDEATLRFILQLNESWILLNLQQGFYRVNYDLDTWESLEKNLFNNDNSMDLDIIKAQLLDDSFQLAKAGRLPYVIPFNLTLNTLKGVSLVELRTIDNHLKFLQPYFQKNGSHQNIFKNFTQKIFQPVSVEDSTRNLNDSLHQRYFQSIILKWNCQNDESDCINWARSVFKSWITNDKYTIEPIFFDIVLCTGIRFGNNEDLKTIVNRSLASHRLPREKLTLLKSLTCSRNSSFILKLIESTLQMVKSNKKKDTISLNVEQVTKMWQGLAENVFLTEDILKFVKQNWMIIYDQYHKDNKVMDSVIKGFTDGLTEEIHLTEVASMSDALIKENKVPPKSLQMATSRLIVKTAWRNTKLNTVIQLLAKYQTFY